MKNVMTRFGIAVCAGLMVAAFTGCPRPNLDARLVVQEIIDLDPPDVIDDDAVDFGLLGGEFELTDGTGHVWDFNASGDVDDGENPAAGTDDAFDDFVELFIDGVQFAGLTTADLEDAREVVFGPVSMSELIVTRKVFVPDDSGFARWLDILENPNKGGAITVDVLIEGDLGSDEDNNFVANSTNGNITLEPTDSWWTNCANPGDAESPSDPCVGSFVCGATITKSEDDISYDFGNITIPAGERVILATYVLMRSNPANPAVALNQLDNALIELQEFPLVGPDFLEGMSGAELNDVFVCGGNIEVAGTPNAVADFSMVSATNSDSGDSASTVANNNGAFALNLIGGTGDTIEVDSTDGQMATMVVP